MIAHGPRIVVHESVVFAELDEEAVLLNVETGVYFGLDEIGTVIWNQLSEGATEDAIIDRILAEYDIDARQVRSDVGDFLAVLLSKGLLQRVPAEDTQ